MHPHYSMALWRAIFFLLQLVSLGSLETQQYFRVQPKNVKMVEGGEAIMECAISHLAGRVQWVMDGFALGFSGTIPGYPRYSIVGNGSQGEFNLRIRNVTLDDDAQFQCQVTPNKNHKAIRAAANLTVLAPPTSITMLNHEPGSKLEVKENQDVALECLTSGSKPATLIIWYRGKDQLKLDKKEERVVSEKKRRSAWSRIRLSPTAEDDGVVYSCEAKHEALPQNKRLRAALQLNVLYPPGVPFIEGYMKGESILRGQVVELTCRSKGGNPPAQLVWYKNGEQVSMEYRTSDKSSENTFTFTATEKDDKAVYLCEASNVMSRTPLKTQVQLNVLYPPSHLIILGASEAKLNNQVNLTCKTTASNPATSIKWTIAGEQVGHISEESVTAAVDGGWITTSNTTVLIETNKTLVVICHGLNAKLNENLVATHTISILSPPEKLEISGYTSGTDLAAGSALRLSCSVSGGNPLPSVNWFKNGQKVHSTNKMTDQTTISELALLTNASDNQAVYACVANNSASEKPLSGAVTLSILFPPSQVKIKQEPETLRMGSKANLTCESEPSNPPAELSWWRNDVPVTDHVIYNHTVFKMYGGVAASIQLSMKVSTESDGVVYTCQATNSALERSIHSSHKLQVVYKPVFLENENQQKGLEGETFTVALKTHAYPAVLTYTWTKNGSPVNSSLIDGSVLSFQNLQRQDEGIYTCEAVNSEGSAFFSFNLQVQYPASIVSVSENTEAGHGENITLACGLEGNPLKAEYVSWKRRGHDVSSGALKSFVNNTSILTMLNVSKEDYGEYLCIVHNGLGKTVQKPVHLFFKHKPEIELSPQLTKAASHIGNTAQLFCHASAAPKPRFTWNRLGSPLAINTTEKYQVFFYQLIGTRYLSKLSVTNVEITDYGNYNCVVRNILGYTSSIIKLTQPSIPDAPLNFKVVNFTQNSVTLSWLPGFDGGEPADFQIRYRQAQSPNQIDSYHKVMQNASQTVISGLKTGTEYIFSIRAINKYGTSRFYSDTVKGVTLSPASAFSLSVGKINGDRSLLFIGLGAGTLLLLINAILLGCCLYKRSDKFSLQKGKSKESAGKTASVEMFTSPSPFTGTGTTETLSSISDKSETFTDPNPDITNENRKVAASMCQRFQNNYSGQYPFINWNCEYGFGTVRRNQPRIHHGVPMSESPYCHSMNRVKFIADSLHPYPGVAFNEIYDHQQQGHPSLPLHYLVPPAPPPPPDVTVLSHHPSLSSFNFNNLHLERHIM